MEPEVPGASLNYQGVTFTLPPDWSLVSAATDDDRKAAAQFDTYMDSLNDEVIQSFVEQVNGWREAQEHLDIHGHVTLEIDQGSVRVVEEGK